MSNKALRRSLNESQNMFMTFFNKMVKEDEEQRTQLIVAPNAREVAAVTVGKGR